MEDYFLKRFENKTRAELRAIVDNKENYQPTAVNAAIQLLNDNDFSEPEPIAKIEIKENSNKSDTLPFFNIRPFIDSFSYRIVLTAFTLALLFIACYEVLEYYSNERFFENNLGVWKFIVLIFLALANHVFYKKEQGRSNNFIGRLITDLLFLFALILVSYFYRFILDPTLSISLGGDMIFVVFGVLIFIVVFEMIVAALKFFLNKIKWQIL